MAGQFEDDEQDRGMGMAGGMPGAAGMPSFQRNQYVEPAQQSAAPPAVAPTGPGAAPAADDVYAEPQKIYVPPSMQTTGGSTESSHLDAKSMARYQAAEAMAEGVDARKIANTEAAGKIARADAADEAAVKQRSAADALEKQQRQEAAIKSGEEEYARRKADYDNEYQKYKEMDLKDFYEGDKTGHRRLWAAMQIGLGGLLQGRMNAANIMVGGPANAQNQGLNLVNAEIERDYERQKAAIEKQHATVGMSEKGMTRSREELDHQLRMLDVKTAAKQEAAASEMSSLLAARGVDRADIAKNAEVNQTLAAAAARKAKLADDLKSEIRSKTERQMVGGQWVTPGEQPADPLEIKGPGGVPLGKAADKDEAKEIRGMNDAYGAFAQHARDLKAMLSKGTSLSPSELQQRSALQQQIQFDIMHLEGFKRYSEKDAEATERLVGGKWSEVTGDTSRLDQLRRQMEGTHRNFLESRGVDTKRAMPLLNGEVRPERIEAPVSDRQLGLAAKALRDPAAPPEVKQQALKIIERAKKRKPVGE